MGNEFDYISENLRRIKADIGEACAAAGRAPESVRLMAVTKTVAPEAVNHAIAEGVDLLGENRVQEFLSKKDSYDSSAEVHMIGHLQTNKVDKVVKHFDYIQSVDSLKLAKAISETAIEIGKIQDILLEVNISKEVQKFGFDEEELKNCIYELKTLGGIKINGLMCMAPFGADDTELDRVFSRAKELKTELNQEYGLEMNELSMGMSDDYRRAVANGATMIRIGRLLFN